MQKWVLCFSHVVAEDLVFLPFAYVEAAATVLTSAALGPYDGIPEFKPSTVKLNKLESEIAAV